MNHAVETSGHTTTKDHLSFTVLNAEGRLRLENDGGDDEMSFAVGRLIATDFSSAVMLRAIVHCGVNVVE